MNLPVAAAGIISDGLGRELFMFRLMLVVCVAAVAPGCIHYEFRPVTAQVVDGDTGEPIAGASIEVEHRFGLPPGTVRVQTDADGRATMQIAQTRARNGSLGWRVSHPGYLERYNVAHDGPRVPSEFATSGGQHAAAMVTLFKGPVPRLTIEVPVGYRGPVALRFVPACDAPFSRRFTAGVSEAGQAEIRVPEPFLDPWYPRLEMDWRYTNGEAVGYMAGESGLAPIWKDELRGLWFIGTRAEAQALRHEVAPWRREPKQIMAMPDFNAQAFARYFDAAPNGTGTRSE